MPRLRALTAAVLLSAAVEAQNVQPLIERPLTLPPKTVDLTLHGTYTNWAAGAPPGAGPASFAGETLALGADFGLPADPWGVVDSTQVGIALAIPVHPGAGFGSILASLLVSRTRILAVRFDGGFESVGLDDGSGHALRYFMGAGARVRAPITRTVAFVMGREGAPQFGQFTNLSQGRAALYLGSAFFTPGAADFLVISGGGQDTTGGSIIGVNLPIGLLLQPDPHLALTIQSGYSTVISAPGGGGEAALHFLPLGVEAVVTPTPAVDIGARFFVDGFVGESGGNNVSVGYFDRRALLAWIRFHVD